MRKQRMGLLLLAVLILGFALTFSVHAWTGDQLLIRGKYIGDRDWKWPVPVSNTISCCYLDYDFHTNGHYALDIAADYGNEVYASWPGEVIDVYKGCSHNNNTTCGCGEGLGNYVYVKHTSNYLGHSFVSRYGHLTSVKVSVGTKVDQNTVIGTIGSTGNSTGPHLDFRIYEATDGDYSGHHAIYSEQVNNCIDPFGSEFLEMPAGVHVVTDDCCAVYINAAKALYAKDPKPPEVVDNTVKASGAVCFSDGKYGAQITAKVRDTLKVDKVYAKFWQVGQSEDQAVTVNAGSFTSVPKKDIPVTISFKPEDYGLNGREGVFQWKLFVSDGYNTTECVVDPQKNESDAINLFAAVPGKKTTGSYKVISDGPRRWAPYEKWNGLDTKLSTVKKDEIVSCIGVYVNSYDHNWYQTEQGDWIYGTHLKKYTSWVKLQEKLRDFADKTIYFMNGQLVLASGGASVLSADRAADNTHATFIVAPIAHMGGGSAPSGNYASVRFDANGGYCNRTSVSYAAGAAYGWLPGASRFGYTFDGWFTAAEGGAQVTADAVCPASGTTLYAHWTRIILLQGSCGPNMNFILYGDGELDITGSGEMTSHPWTKDFTKSVFYVKMEGEIKSVCDDAFNGCIYLNEVLLPDSLSNIGVRAFKECTDLNGVSFSEGLLQICESAFQGCTELTELTFPTTFCILDKNAFADCTNLRSVFVPKALSEGSVTYVYNDVFGSANGPFSGCTNLSSVKYETGTTIIHGGMFAGSGLKHIVVPEGVTEIGKMAFAFTPAEAVDFPDSLTTIGERAFWGCKQLTEVRLPKHLSSTGKRVFMDCTSLQRVNIPKSWSEGNLEYTYNLYMDSVQGPFVGCTSLSDVAFEEGTKYIHGGMFGGSGIRSIHIPDTVIFIGPYAFAFTPLESIEFPDALTKIGERAFWRCDNLESLVLPKHLDTIEEYAFRECNQLKNVYIPNSVNNGSVSWGYDDLNGDRCEGIFFGCGRLENVTFEEGATIIHGGLFAGSGLKSIVIPDSVRVIGQYAFGQCKNLEAITISKELRYIGTYAFWHCESLETVELPETVYELSPHCFEKCYSLKNINLPSALVELKEGVFDHCTSLEEIDLPQTLTSIGGACFNCCTSLSNVVLPSGLKTIAYYAFNNCPRLNQLEFPASLTAIGNDAFTNCDTFTKVEIPDGITEIASNAFSDCDGLTSVVIPDSVTTIGRYAFYSCDGLTDIRMGTAVKTIGNNAFASCASLETVVLPYSVTTISNEAFAKCTALKEITIPRGTTTIAADAFTYPERLTIYGVAGTRAESYANEIGATFVAIDHPVEKVAFKQQELTIKNGEKIRLVPEIVPFDFTDEVKWKSSNTEVATVSEDGIVTAVGKGTAVISVVAGNKKATCKLTVLQPVDGIYLECGSTLELEHGDTYTITAYVDPENADNRDVIWTSSDETVASVTQDGTVTALKKGTATITCTAQDGSGVSKSCTVTVLNDVFIITDVKELQSTHPYPENCSDIWSYRIPGAEYLYVTFSADTSVEEGSDYIYLLDADGYRFDSYTGSELAGKTVCVDGDTIQIQIVSDDSYNEYGFAVTSVTADGAEHQHAYTETVTPPTCTEQGFTTHTCACGESYTDSYVDALGHDWGAWIVTTPATESAEGVETRTCSRCGETEERSIPKLDPVTGFTDVPSDAFYAAPVAWAVENGITSGVGNNRFAPNDTCTRSQAVTFLWRAMGRPEPQTTVNPFTDVFESDWYYKPVLWAAENNITSGVGGGRFDPDGVCNRSQIVTFLWRAKGCPEPENTDNPFTDVSESGWYFKPVLWAVEQGITYGVGNGRFDPNGTCTRGQIVTFLFRDLGE